MSPYTDVSASASAAAPARSPARSFRVNCVTRRSRPGPLFDRQNQPRSTSSVTPSTLSPSSGHMTTPPRRTRSDTPSNCPSVNAMCMTASITTAPNEAFS